MIFFSKSSLNSSIKVKGFFSLKRPEEQIGISTVKFKDIQISKNEKELHNSIKEFFKNGIYNPIEYRDVLTKEVDQKDDDFRQIASFKYYCKSVWLADGFLEKNELDHPLNIFWCPETNLTENINKYFRIENQQVSKIVEDLDSGFWAIANGHGRAQFLSYFLLPDDDVKVLAFNTFGKKLDFDILMNHENDLKEYFGEGMNLHISLNWGTAIPFVNTSIARKVPDVCTEYHKKIYDWFKSTEITSNVKLSLYNLQPPNTYHRRKIKGNVHFELTSDLLEKNSKGEYSSEFYFIMNKICILLPLMNEKRNEYQDYKFTIKYTSM
jgi:hypothetical protein